MPIQTISTTAQYQPTDINIKPYNMHILSVRGNPAGWLLSGGNPKILHSQFKISYSVVQQKTAFTDK